MSRINRQTTANRTAHRLMSSAVIRKAALSASLLVGLFGTAAQSAAAELPSLGSSNAPVVGETLQDFFSAALDFSPRLRIAEQNLNIGAARRSAATGQLLPQVRANASLSDNTRVQFGQETTFDGNRYSLQLTQVLFNWQAFAARAQAVLREDQAEQLYYSELAILLTDVAEKFFDTLQARDALDSIASEYEAVSNQLQQIESLYARQLAQITDLYQAQASLASVEAQQIQLESRLDIQLEALRSVSGIEPGELFRLAEGAKVPPLENNLHYWVDQAEKNNHSIKAQRLAFEASKKMISQRRGAYMPQVSLVLQRQDSDVGFDNMPLQRSDNTYIGVDVSVPIYAGGSNRAAVREANSQSLIAENELRGVQLEIGETVRSAYLQVQASEKIIGAAQKLVESTELSATAMQRGFELGAVTSVDVLNAIRDQFGAQRDLQQVRYEHVKFLLLLKREAGLLTADDLIEVSTWLEPSTGR
ncbi:TolC family outer membrane protein [Gammaproteobacteria bacterium]|nr:TolC family outer membrane protein [Gammaproteobacteria bacterium]MDC1422819.1 TolC family outer membrane protein [Gammaproteobacteria bacterium]MDC1510681.1 TolC family outer membrane protein [Gammaproteobacteria bacterium]